MMCAFFLFLENERDVCTAVLRTVLLYCCTVAVSVCIMLQQYCCTPEEKVLLCTALFCTVERLCVACTGLLCSTHTCRESYDVITAVGTSLSYVVHASPCPPLALD